MRLPTRATASPRDTARVLDCDTMWATAAIAGTMGPGHEGHTAHGEADHRDHQQKRELGGETYLGECGVGAREPAHHGRVDCESEHLQDVQADHGKRESYQLGQHGAVYGGGWWHGKSAAVVYGGAGWEHWVCSPAPVSRRLATSRDGNL